MPRNFLDAKLVGNQNQNLSGKMTRKGFWKCGAGGENNISKNFQDVELAGNQDKYIWKNDKEKMLQMQSQWRK